MASSPKSGNSVSVKRRRRSAPQTKLYGSTEPRIWTPELRELTEETTLGYECIRFAESNLDLELMPWQKWFLLHALELHPTEVDDHGEPTFRFRKVILLVGRQNGKSTVMQVLTLWRMYVDRCSLVLGTARDLEVAESLWAESIEMAQENEDLKDEIGKVERQPGRKMFRLRTGETYKVKAATRRGGRGLSGELVLLDELREHQSWDSWAAVTKTTNAKSRAQIYGVSNAGDATSIVLRFLRKKAHEELGDPDGINTVESPEELIADEDEVDEYDDIDSGLAIFEWSAPAGCSVTDRAGLAQANPALGHRVRMTTLLADSGTDPEWIFRTECMCQWSDGTLEGPFPPGSWDAGKITDDPPKIVGKVKACIDMSHDRTRTHIVFAGVNDRGRPQVEAVASRAGSDWVKPWLTDSKRVERIEEITGQTRGAPISGLMADLKTADLPVVDWGGTDLGAATGAFYDAVRSNDFDHLPQPVLDIPAGTAVARPSGDAFLWDRNHSPTDIAPLIGATGALWLLTRAKPAPTISVYETRGVLTV